MPADVAPLVADGGNIRLVRRVAAYAYGSREVTWPDDAEDPKDELPDGREFGWVAQLTGPRPGLSGRRFVRADAVIDAVEGVSNTEQLLDDAAERTGGDVHFETLITGRGLAGQEPGVDFRLGDRVPARFWGRVLPGQLVTEVGWEEDGPYVKLGGQMLRDLDALARARAELKRTIRKEREETAGAVESVRSYADSAVSRERTERVADVAQVREVLGGPDATDTSLLSQLAAVQAQITGMGERPAQPGLLAAYLATNTALWKAQQEIDRLQNERTDELTAQLIETQKLVERARVDVVTLSRSELPWVSDLVRVRWSDADGVVVEPVNRRRSHVVATVSDGDASRVHVDTLPTRLGAQSMVLSGPAGLLSRSGVVGLVVRGAPGVERRLVRTIPGQTPRTKAWVQVAQITVPERTTSAVASLRILWASTGYKDVLGVRVRVGSRTLLEKTGVSTGSPLQGVKAQLHTAGGVAVQPGDVVIFECKNESDYVDRQVISGGEALLAVIEQSEV